MKHRLIRTTAPWLLTLGLVCLSQAARAQEPTLGQVLARTTEYVEALTTQLSGMGQV